MDNFFGITMFNLKTLLKGKKSVQIEFSEDEYKKLIESVFVGEWVLTHDVEVNNAYDLIRNKIYSYAHEMGLSICITLNWAAILKPKILKSIC